MPQSLNLYRSTSFQGVLKLLRIKHIPNAPRCHGVIAEHHHDIGD